MTSTNLAEGWIYYPTKQETERFQKLIAYLKQNKVLSHIGICGDAKAGLYECYGNTIDHRDSKTWCKNSNSPTVTLVELEVFYDYPISAPKQPKNEEPDYDIY